MQSEEGSTIGSQSVTVFRHKTQTYISADRLLEEKKKGAGQIKAD